MSMITLLWGGLAAGSDIVVTNNSSSGPGSLLEAINTADTNPGADTITFDLPAGSETITLTTKLSDVLDDATTIDGGGTVIISGENLSAGSDDGLKIKSNNCVIKGLTIINFGGVGIYIDRNNNQVLGCRIGTDGISDLGNGEGILIDKGDNNQIGGDTEADRNIISGNNSNGVRLLGSFAPDDPASGNIIIGNYIGTDATGMYAIPNNVGVNLAKADNNLIGRPDTGEGNLISGNTLSGILSGAGPVDNTIQGNRIGTDATGAAPLPNGSDGIFINGAQGYTIGGTTLESGNTIAFNGRDGVLIAGASALYNTINHNSIHSNGVKGIELQSSNGGIAAPNITGISPVDGIGPANATIEIFVDDADEGRIFVDSVTANASGGFSSLADLSAYDGKNVTASATDAAGNTSEFGGGNQFTYYNDEGDPVELVPNGSVTSTLYIPGSITIDDINVGLDINCSSTSALVVQLESPDGTSISLFSEVDNNGEDFNDTLLDDEADTDIGLGLPPFTGSFRPMGLLSTYDGANAKGTWTLTVTDVGGTTTGSIYSWFVEITGHIRGTRPCTVYESSAVPMTIQSGDRDSSVLTLPNLGLVEDVNVTFTLNIDYVDGISVELESPEGTEFMLVNQPPVSGSNYTDTTLDDEADIALTDGDAPFTGSFRPLNPLSILDGETTEGTWLLIITNDTGDPAELVSWSLCLVSTGAQQEGEEDPLLEACPLGSLFGQGPHAPAGNWTAPTANTLVPEDRPLEYFSGVAEPISVVTWWGYTAGEDAGLWFSCVPQPTAITITFYEDDGGQPAENSSFFESVEPVKVNTGVSYILPGAFVMLYRYQFTLSTPVSLASGWVRVSGTGSSDCNMHWMSSPQGDGAAILMDAFGNITPLDYDLSLCLGAETPVEGAEEGEGVAEGEGTAEGEGELECTRYHSGDTPMDLRMGETTISTLTVPDTLTIADLDVQLDITCNSTSALIVQLESPDGIFVTLFNELDNDGQNFEQTILDDEADVSIFSGYPPFSDVFQPGSPLSAFDGYGAAGTWTLTIEDAGGGSFGTLNGWSICITPMIEEEGEGGEEGEVVEPIEPCPGESIFSQPPHQDSSPWQAPVCQIQLGFAYENFSGVSEPIGSVTWWGFDAHEDGGVFSTCTTSGMFQVSFAENDGGIPGASLGAADGVAEKVDTGAVYTLPGAFVTIYRYTLTLDTPIAVSEGFVGISSLSSSLPCEWHWVSSPVGDGQSLYHSGAKTYYDTQAYDLSVCFGAGVVTEGEGGAEGEGEEGEGEEGEGEGGVEGEGEEGEGMVDEDHSADPNGDGLINLSELLRVIQFFNSSGYHCQAGTEDDYAPGPGDTSCAPHDSDYNPQDWFISLSELLRIIQFFNSGGYHYCPGEGTEDGFCPGPA